MRHRLTRLRALKQRSRGQHVLLVGGIVVAVFGGLLALGFRAVDPTPTP